MKYKQCNRRIVNPVNKDLCIKSEIEVAKIQDSLKKKSKKKQAKQQKNMATENNSDYLLNIMKNKTRNELAIPSSNRRKLNFAKKGAQTSTITSDNREKIRIIELITCQDLSMYKVVDKIISLDNDVSADDDVKNIDESRGKGTDGTPEKTLLIQKDLNIDLKVKIFYF